MDTIKKGQLRVFRDNHPWSGRFILLADPDDSLPGPDTPWRFLNIWPGGKEDWGPQVWLLHNTELVGDCNEG